MTVLSNDRSNERRFRRNVIQTVEAFVDGLDLLVAGFARACARATGRTNYDSADLLKLYIYGYLNRVRASRRLEAELSATSR